MAAIAVTAANVARIDGNTATYLSGATITAGMAVYVDANGLVQIATNATSVGSGFGAQYVGVALNGGSAGQPIQIALDNATVNIGGTPSQGKPYVIGTGGGIIPVDDIAGGENITLFAGALDSTNKLKLSIMPLGVTAAAAVT